MKWNSHTIKLTILYWTIQWQLAHSKRWATTTSVLSQNISSSQNKNPYPLSSCSLSSPGPQPLATTNMHSVSMDLSILIFHINGIIHYVILCAKLLSQSIMFWRFIHNVYSISTSFLFMAKYYIVRIYHNLCIHSSIDGHLRCFHLLALVNSCTYFKLVFNVFLTLLNYKKMRIEYQFLLPFGLCISLNSLKHFIFENLGWRICSVLFLVRPNFYSLNTHTA